MAPAVFKLHASVWNSDVEQGKLMLQLYYDACVMVHQVVADCSIWNTIEM